MESGFGSMAIGGVRAAAAWAAGALFPHFCAACGAEGRSVCAACEQETLVPGTGLFVCPGCEKPTPLGARCGAPACEAMPLDGLVSTASYKRPVLQRLLQEYKYGRVEESGDMLRRAFGASVRAHAEAFRTITQDAIIVPIPLHPLKAAERGFNQAELFARELGRLTDRPVVTRMLTRAFGGKAQATMEDAEARAANAAGKFGVRLRVRQGQRFVLVDDVATTRATLGDAARALKAAGAAEVWGVTLLQG